MKFNRSILIALLLVLQGFAARAAIHYVNVNSVNPVAPYSSAATAATNLQSAFDVAASFDEILVSDGVYSVGGKVSRDGATNRAVTGVPVTIQSVNGTNFTIIDGGGLMRCLYLVAGCTLNGFTISNGVAASGGGVYCAGSAFVNNCLFTSNTATLGGGIYGGTLTGCTLSSNICPASSSAGGGAFHATLNQCSLIGNIVGDHLNSTGTAGGAASSCTLNNCAILGNSSYGSAGDGAGAASSTVNTCLLLGNSADGEGGGAFSCALNNCVLAENSAVAGGGGALGTLNNCTVYNNQSSIGGGGGTFQLSANNSIIYGNAPSDTRNSILNYCCTPDVGNAGCITNAPLFISPATDNFRPQTLSPCVNGGNNSLVSGATDLDGNVRIAGGTVDIGAYELQSATTNSGLPAVPINFTGTFPGNVIAFQWNASAKAASYNLFTSSSADGSSKLAGYDLGGTNYGYDGFTRGGTATYYLTASNAYGQSAASMLVTITAVDHFALTPIASPQTAGAPFSITITAADKFGNVITNFTNACLLAVMGDHGNVPLSPAIAGPFTKGQWTGLVTLDSSFADVNVRLTAFTNNVTGVSAVFNSIASPIQVFNLTAADLVYSPLKQRLYATLPAIAPTNANSLVVIDPMLGRIENVFYLGNDPSQLAVSADGQYLYVGFNGANVLSRFNIASNAVDLSFPLTNKSGSPYEATSIAALPGLPHSVAVAGASTAIFDDGIERTNIYAVGNLVVAASATQLFTMGGGFPPGPFTLLTADATGINTNFIREDGIVGTNETFKYQSGLIFTSTGTVFNPAHSNILGHLTNCAVIEPDLPAGLIFALGSQPVSGQPDAWTLYVWNTNFEVVTNLPIPGVLAAPTTLVRWGANGLAFTADKQLYLVRIATMIPTVPPAIIAASIQSAATNFQFNFTGDPATPYSISASANLTTWTNLGPPNLISNTLFQFTDPNTTNFAARFYRVSNP